MISLSKFHGGKKILLSETALEGKITSLGCHQLLHLRLRRPTPWSVSLLWFGFAPLLMPSNESWPCRSQALSTSLNGLTPEHLISFVAFVNGKPCPVFSFHFPNFNQFANQYAAFTDTHRANVLCPWTDK